MIFQFDPSRVEPTSFTHVVDHLRVLETHISWVFLTGQFAYKVKKPVALDFVDFHTLAQRKFFCEHELQLNSQLAPQLYLEVVPIGGTAEQPRFGTTPAFEYAVKMHQFGQTDRLDHLLASGHLHLEDAAHLGEYVATMHAHAQRVDETSGCGKIRSVTAPIVMNYRTLEKLQLAARLRSRLLAQRQHDMEELRRLRPVLTQRYRDGFVRDCHGDLHLGNLVRLDGQIVPFDRLEFDPALRWIDVINEAAFPYMDLIYQGHSELAFEYLNTYVEHTGDYAGLEVLPLYATYKAIIRAKVSACDTSQSADLREASISRHIDCAARLSHRGEPRILLMHGFSCSGKSRVANALKRLLPAIRLRADVERKRGFGLAPLANAAASPGVGIYSAEATQELYKRLSVQASSILAAGFHVIVDATFLALWQRKLFQDLAADTGHELVIVACQARVEILQERLVQRSAAADDPSDADIAVLAWQQANADALTPAEQASSVVINTETEPDLATAVKAILQP